MFKLVVLFALLALAAAKPGYLHGGVAAYAAAPGAVTYAAAPGAVAYAAPAVAYSAPLTATAITKNVHYAATPVVTGYTAQVIKPNLGAIATPTEIVSQEKVIAPARAVATVTQQITQVQPEVTVQKVAVDVPVHTPVVSQVQVHAPAVTTYAAAPAISYAAGPAYAYGAGPAYAYGAGPAYSYGAYPVGLNTIAYGAGGVHYKTIGPNGVITKIH